MTKPLTERQIATLHSFARSANENGEFPSGLTSGPNGSMVPSLLKRGLIESVEESAPKCDYCGRGPNTWWVMRLTEAGLDACKD